MLSNGEKFQPHAMELAIAVHPAVKSAVVAGQGRFQISLLIEPADAWKIANGDKEDLRDVIWPTVIIANQSAPAHARLSKEHILIAREEKPFSRTSKGTIRRGPTLELYKADFDRVYDEADTINHDGAVLGNDQLSPEAIVDVVRAAFQELSLVQHLKDTDNFFTASAMDSLQVLTLGRRLRRRIPTDALQGAALDTRMIYRNPTVAAMAKAIYDSVAMPQQNGVHASDLNEESQTRHLLSKYTADFIPLETTSRTSSPRVSPTVVILTGSTGSLGSYILNDLMARIEVHEIWCLNRSADAESRQLVSNTRRGLSTDFAVRGVHFLQANLSLPTLGLIPEDLGYLHSRATHIIRTFHIAFSCRDRHLLTNAQTHNGALILICRWHHSSLKFKVSGI